MKSKTLFQIAKIVVVSALCASVFVANAAETNSPAPITFKLDISRQKNYGDSPIIIVPTVFVKLPLSGKIFAVKQGSALSTLGGGSANTVRASAHYVVSGLDKKLAQEIAGKVYDDFVAQLRAAGFTVKTYADIKDLDFVKAAGRESADGDLGLPTEKDRSGNVVYAVAAPGDEQAFQSGLSSGVFNQFAHLGKSKFSEGTMIIPTYTIAAPQAWGETGSGVGTISASANVQPGMSLMSAGAPLLTAKGGWGGVQTKAPVRISEKVGELTKEDTTSHAGNAFSKSLSLLSGAGSITGSSANYQFTIDPAAYETGVLTGAAAFNAEVAKIAGEAKK